MAWKQNEVQYGYYCYIQLAINLMKNTLVSSWNLKSILNIYLNIFKIIISFLNLNFKCHLFGLFYHVHIPLHSYRKLNVSWQN